MRHKIQDAMLCYLPQGLPNIYSLLLCPSMLPLYLRLPPLPSLSPSSLHLRTPAIAQSSAKLSGGGGGGGGEKRIFPSQLLPGPLGEAHLS